MYFTNPWKTFINYIIKIIILLLHYNIKSPYILQTHGKSIHYVEPKEPYQKCKPIIESQGQSPTETIQPTCQNPENQPANGAQTCN